jgi:hypothetical protein
MCLCLAFSPIVSIMVLSTNAFAKDPSDLSTPKSAAKSFYNALLGGDVAGVHNDAVGSPNDFRTPEALARFVEAGQRLRKSVDRRFGKDEGDKLHVAPSPTADEMARQIDTWEEQINGDAATVHEKGAPADSGIQLQKIGVVWKVRLDDFGDRQFREQAKYLPKLTSLLETVAAEVERGEYAAAEAMAEKFQEGVRKITDQPQPTTQPVDARKE